MNIIRNNCPVTGGNITQPVRANINDFSESLSEKPTLKVTVSKHTDIGLPEEEMASNIDELYSASYISKLCKYYGVQMRNRKIDYVSLIYRWFTAKIESLNSKCELLIGAYFTSIMNEFCISSPALHYQLGKAELVKVLISICVQAIRLNIRNACKKPTLTGKLVGDLLKGTGCTSLLHCDGTEISVNPQVNKKLGRPGKGRKRNQNSQRPGHKNSSSSSNKGVLKAHVMYNGAFGCIESLTVTHGTHSEREILMEQIAGILSIPEHPLVVADRGYFSKEVVSILNNENVKFVIRLQIKSALRIRRAVDRKGRQYPELEGCKVSDEQCFKLAKAVKMLDFEVYDESGVISNCRVVLKLNPNENVEKDKFMLLLTNLSRKKADVKKLFAVYRLRWQIENECMKTLKGCCGMCKINSGKVTVNTSNILSSLCVYQLIFSIYQEASTSALQELKSRVSNKALQELADKIDRIRSLSKARTVPDKSNPRGVNNIHLPPEVSIAKTYGHPDMKDGLRLLFESKKVTMNIISKTKQRLSRMAVRTCLKDTVIPFYKIVHLKDVRLNLISNVFS